jgi:DNA-binding MarR family transcriptional regulator
MLVTNRLSKKVTNLPSDVKGAPPAAASGELSPSAFVESWEQSASLTALRELIDVAAAVPAAVAARAALTHHELTALEHLMDGPMGPVELSKVLGVTSAASSGVVDRLVARGHATRTPHEHDRRRTVVTISDSGRDEVLGYLMPMFVALQQMDARLNDADRSVVTAYLGSATAAMRRLL